jgi:hypothetical protein
LDLPGNTPEHAYTRLNTPKHALRFFGEAAFQAILAF